MHHIQYSVQKVELHRDFGVLPMLIYMPGRVAQSVGHLTHKSGPGFDTWSGNILSFLFPLFQEGQ